MAHILNILYVTVVVVLMFGAAIFVHEFGHYWVARKRGLKVDAFAIGFGPKLFGWTRDGIEYSWRLIPAGGYVKLPQMVTSSALEGVGEEADKVPPASPGSKILVALAGPFMNVVFAFAIATIIYFTGLPVPVNPPIIGYVEPNSPEENLGIREGDRIISVNGKHVKSWQDVLMNTVFALTNTIPVVIEHDGKQSTYGLTAKVSEIVGLKVLNLDPKEHPVVKSLEANSPAAQAGLKLDDEFVSFGDVPVVSHEQLIGLIRKRPNQATDLTIKRGDHKLKLTVTPAINPDTKQGRIGVLLGGSNILRYELQKPGPTPWLQVSTVWQRTIDTLGALFHSKQTGVGVKDLSGPPGIIAMLASQVNADFRLALSFLVLLNINLAIINMLPVPVLDGGHILMAIIEKLFRRPLSARFVEYTTTAFAVLLISFMLFVSFNDVTKRFSLFKSMFQHETRVEQSAPNDGSEK
ncbi:MAG: RIP metalloprotease RseP [Verrucomicrobiota bacterium]|nr:RIP metalloprotease RseP [Verrucomicrobiota bacterium]